MLIQSVKHRKQFRGRMKGRAMRMVTKLLMVISV